MTSTYARRVANLNPVHPYAWEARYRGGGRLRQFDADGHHFTREIDRARIEALVVLGAEGGEIVLPVLPSEGAAPDEVIVKAVNDIVETIEAGRKRLERSARYKFGFRYGVQLFLIEIDEAGKVWKTNSDA